MAAEWADVTLGDVCTIQGGFAFKSKDFKGSGIPVVKIKNVRKGTVDVQDVDYVAPDIAARARDYFVNQGDVLISMTGSGPNSPASIVGRVAVHTGGDKAFVINQRVGRFRPIDEKTVNLRYLYFLFSQSVMQDYLVSIATGSANQVNLSARQIMGTKLRLPPIHEQKAIAHILGTLDDKIELNRQMNATLESMAQALFKSWFVDFDPVIDNALAAGNDIPEPLQAKAEARKALGDKRKSLPEAIQKLFPDRFVFTGEMGWVPEGWPVGKLEDLLVLQRGFDLPKAKRTDGEYPLMVASGQDGTHNEFKVTGPGVTTGRSGKLGDVSLVLDDFWPLNTTLWVKEYKNSSPYHAYYLLQSLELGRYNAGSAVPTLNRNHAHNIATLVAPKSLIEVYDQFVSPLFDKKAFCRQQAEQVETIRDTLLPKLLSGELRIPDAEQQVAEAS